MGVFFSKNRKQKRSVLISFAALFIVWLAFFVTVELMHIQNVSIFFAIACVFIPLALYVLLIKREGPRPFTQAATKGQESTEAHISKSNTQEASSKEESVEAVKETEALLQGSATQIEGEKSVTQEIPVIPLDNTRVRTEVSPLPKHRSEQVTLVDISPDTQPPVYEESTLASAKEAALKTDLSSSLNLEQEQAQSPVLYSYQTDSLELSGNLENKTSLESSEGKVKLETAQVIPQPEASVESEPSTSKNMPTENPGAELLGSFEELVSKPSIEPEGFVPERAQAELAKQDESPADDVPSSIEAVPELEPMPLSMSFEKLFDKAQGLAKKKHWSIAAHLYEESALYSENQEEILKALFAAMSSYLKAKKNTELARIVLLLQERDDLSSAQSAKLTAISLLLS